MFGSTKKLERRLESLEETLGRLERGFQSLELEWVNAYGKFRKIASRISHDQAVIDSREQTADGAGAGHEVVSSVTGPGLSSHQRAIQQQVLRRRGGMSS